MQGINLRNIATKQVSLPSPANHPFNKTIQLAYESFKEKGVDMLNTMNFVSHDLSDAAIATEYMQEMYGDIKNEDFRANCESVFDNTINEIRLNGGQIAAEDGSLANATTFAYLNGPVIRAVFARSIVPAVMKTVALKQTSYTATFDIPYIIKDKKRHDLPYELVAGMDDDDYREDLAGLTPLIPSADSDDWINDDGSIKVDGEGGSGNLINESLKITRESEYDGRMVDRRIFIKDVKYKTKKDGTAATVTLGKSFAPSSTQGKAGNVIFVVTLKDVALRNDIENDTYDAATVEGQEVLFVHIDLATGEYGWSTTGKAIESFRFDAYLSPEDNRTPSVLKTEQHSLEVMIGAGQHIMIDTPVELLQEYPTSHQGSDYIVALTDICSEFFAGNMNLQMLRFQDDSFKSSQSTYIPETVLRGLNLSKEFDLRVSHGADPTAYVNVALKKCFAFYMNAIHSYSRITDGCWTIVGHANNVMHLPDFSSQSFASVNNDGDEAREDVFGFKPGYVLGFATSITNGKIRALYTPEIPMKKNLIATFTSNDDRRPTYIFHPFSYTITRGYNNPNNVLNPSIMVTKRHTFQEFVPMQLRLKLTGNDGSQFTNPTTVTTPAPSTFAHAENASIY